MYTQLQKKVYTLFPVNTQIVAGPGPQAGFNQVPFSEELKWAFWENLFGVLGPRHIEYSQKKIYIYI